MLKAYASRLLEIGDRLTANSKHSPKISISVVSHDPQILDEVPENPILRKVLLSELDIPQRYTGNNLAESRFLIGSHFLEGTFDFRGFVSARWDQRFPKWPKLSAIDVLFKDLNMETYSRTFFAPNCKRLKESQVHLWVKSQDKFHPGMTALVEELIEFNKISFNTSDTYNLVMGNNFILPTAIAEDFLKFWHESFSYLEMKYGLDFPFEYRCHKCGFNSSQGVDRWSRDRHAGFLLERLSALYFLSRSELVPLQHRNGRISHVGKEPVYRGHGVAQRLQAISMRAFGMHKSCRIRHERLDAGRH